MSKNISYDGIFKELLDEIPDENVVEFINKLFERDYPRNSEVLRLATESHVDGKERRSDKILRVGGNMYHVEVESGDSSDMALRIFEYSYRAALQHGKTIDKNYLKLDFPKSVVFYLRTNTNTPHEITIELNLPDGNTVKFKTPTKHLKEYTLQDLTHDSSFILAPYYPMLFEGELLKLSQELLERLKNDTLFIIDKIKEKAAHSEIGRKSADLIIKSLDDILENTMVKANINQKEVDEVMEAVRQQYHLEPLNWREEGKIEGKEEDARKMFIKGFSFEDIQDITGLKTEILQKIQFSISK